MTGKDTERWREQKGKRGQIRKRGGNALRGMNNIHCFLLLSPFIPQPLFELGGRTCTQAVELFYLYIASRLMQQKWAVQHMRGCRGHTKHRNTACLFDQLLYICARVQVWFQSGMETIKSEDLLPFVENIMLNMCCSIQACTIVFLSSFVYVLF